MQRIAQYLAPERIIVLEDVDKKEALNSMVDAIATSPDVEDANALRDAIFARERILSTGIGLGIAIPHAKIPGVKQFLLAVGVSHKGVPFQSLDGNDVHIIVMIAGPEGQQEQYLRVLARTTLVLKDESNRESLLSSPTCEELWGLFSARIDSGLQ